jgi:hypothetical protein
MLKSAWLATSSLACTMIDVFLQRLEIRQHLRIAIIVLLGEYPAELACRLLGHSRGDLRDAVVFCGSGYQYHRKVAGPNARIGKFIPNGCSVGVEVGIRKMPRQ